MLEKVHHKCECGRQLMSSVPQRRPLTEVVVERGKSIIKKINIQKDLKFKNFKKVEN